MHIIVKHEGEQVGRVFTSGGLTKIETLRLAGIDLEEMDGGDFKWDWDKFELDALSDTEYAEALAKGEVW